MDQEEQKPSIENQVLKPEEQDTLIKQEILEPKSVTNVNLQQPTVPQIKQSSKDITPPGDRRSSYLDQDDLSKVAKIFEENKQKDRLWTRLKFRQNLAIFLNSRFSDFIIISLVVIYTLLVFINFMFTSKDAAADPDIAMTLYVTTVIELVILVVFMTEIILKTYANGFANYFKDYWVIFDTIVILISIIMNILDFNLDNNEFKTASKVLRGIFRFLRLFLVFRKFNQVKKITTSSNRYNVRAPIEKILEILTNLKTEFDDEPEIVSQLSWSIEKISSNKLFEVIAGDQKDASQWIEQMGQHKETKQIVLQKRGTVVGLDFTELHRSSIKLQIPSEVIQSFSDSLQKLDYDYFSLYEEHKSNILPFLLDYLFDYYGLYHSLEIPQELLHSFAVKIASGYHEDIPYHNVLHAFDVTQTVNFFISVGNFKEIANLSEIDLCIMLIAAAIHDYDHPQKISQKLLTSGLNNPYQTNFQTTLGIRYNDKSPLENHHVSQTFFILREEQYNILKHFKKDKIKYFRERVIAMILCTDMALHFPDHMKLKGRLISAEFDPKSKDKALCMESLLHAADISNPFKPLDTYEKWTKRVLDEFWNQQKRGIKKEKLACQQVYCVIDIPQMQVSPKLVLLITWQIKFINQIKVQPYYETLKQFLPVLGEYIPQIESNKLVWKEKIDYYDKELSKIIQINFKELLNDQKNNVGEIKVASN